MSERTWNVGIEPKHSLETFLAALEQADAKLQRVLTPISLVATGLRFPSLDDGHYNEPYWFADTLTLRLATESKHRIHYTLDGTPPSTRSPRYLAPIELRDETALRARAFSTTGEPVGYEIWNVYELHPIHGRIDGELLEPLSTLWEKRHAIARFSDEVTVTLHAKRAGTIRYTIDGAEPVPSSWMYRTQLRIEDTSHVRAQLFDAEGRRVGRPWEQRFEKVGADVSHAGSIGN